MRKTMPFFDFDNPPIDPIKLKEEMIDRMFEEGGVGLCLLYTSPSPRDQRGSGLTACG